MTYALNKLLSRIQPDAYYAGIGSRKAPKSVQDLMTDIARKLSASGMILRSGGADGPDKAFASGAERAHIWRPSTRYRPTVQELEHVYRYVGKEDLEAWNSVAIFHPAHEKLNESDFALMARNYRQVIGEGGLPNSSFVVSWTPVGSLTGAEFGNGGTGQAIRIAYDRSIPVYNLQRPEHEKLWREYLEHNG